MAAHVVVIWPLVMWSDSRRCLRCMVTRDTWHTDYRVVPYVTRPGAPVSTRASFVTERDNPGIQKA